MGFELKSRGWIIVNEGTKREGSLQVEEIASAKTLGQDRTGDIQGVRSRMVASQTEREE